MTFLEEHVNVVLSLDVMYRYCPVVFFIPKNEELA
jgi:hypothetical protein